MWIVMTSSASMPASCKGRYRNVALVKLTPEFAANEYAAGQHPARIDARAKGVARILHQGAHHVGKTDRGAYQRALAEAERTVITLNAGGGFDG